MQQEKTHKIGLTKNYYAIDRAYREAMSDFDNKERKKGIFLEGSSRSGKSYAEAIWLTRYVNDNQGKVITCCRDTFANLKISFYSTLKKVWQASLMPMKCFNKSATTIHYNGNEIRFVGVNDDIGRAMGMEQDVLMGAEVIYLLKDVWDQMEQRTEEFFIADYNPAEEKSWVYKYADHRPDVFHFKSTYKDNPFAPLAQVAKIEAYNPWHWNDMHLPEEKRRENDRNVKGTTANKFKWQVFGEGIRSAGEDRIYRFELFKDFPESYDWKIYGVDFGYSNDVAAVCEVMRVGHKLYVKELIYELGLINVSPKPKGHKNYKKNLLHELERLQLDEDCYVVCDSQAASDIAELRLGNINAIACRKGKGSIKSGIDKIEGFQLLFHVESVNLQDEGRGYKWMRDKKTNERLNLPVDKDNHLMDAMRYAATKLLG